MDYRLFNLCPEQESNLHLQKETWPSTMRVYQFRHLGVRADESGKLNFKTIHFHFK